VAVGDVSSQERGAGARYNDGKPELELIPLTLIADQWSLDQTRDLDDLALQMRALGAFQETGALIHVRNAIAWAGAPWHDCARVFAYGRKKYAAWNWVKGMPWSVPLACAARHLMAMAGGEVNDPESGLPHSGHVMCNLVMLATFHRIYPEGNDLPIEWLGPRDKALEALILEDTAPFPTVSLMPQYEIPKAAMA
jgi:hypothetical protein